jgi:prepilin peptidase CpaA
MSLPTLSVWNWTTLSCLLLLAVWQDLAHRRIPNPLLLCTASAALVLAAMPQGTGLVSALAAALVAGGAFVPLYLLGQMGAGDIKLMATAGLLVGMPRALALCLSVAMAGGLLALGWAWHTRRPAPASARIANRMPYAVAVALGSAWHGLLTLPFP